jgi:hypothetical protein
MRTSTNTSSNIYLQDPRRKTVDGMPSTKHVRHQPRSYTQVSDASHGYQTRSVSPPAPMPAPPAQLQALQTQAQSVQRQKEQIMQNQPTYAEVARDSARKFFKDNYNLDLDPDATYLNTFAPPSKDRAWTASPQGFTHSPDRLKSSQSLTELFLHNVDGDFTQQSQDMPQTYGIYTRQDKDAPYNSSDSLVPIAEFGKKFRQSDTLGEFNKRNDAFWAQNSQGIAQAAKEDAQLQVQLQQQLQLGNLTERDYKDFDAAIQVRSSEASDTIKEGEISGDQEAVNQAIRRTHLSVSPLDIDGFQSHDILRIEHNLTKQNLLYVPGDEQPLRKFGNREAVSQYLHEQARQPGWAQDFATRHFSQNAARGREALSGDMARRSNGLGVQKYLEQTVANEAEAKRYPFLHRSELKYRLDPKELTDHQDIEGDAFERLTQIKKEGSQADARMDITTHADVDRGNLFAGTKWIPFVGGGLKLALGKTRQEQTEGGAALTLDVVSAPFDLAPGLAAKRGSKLDVGALQAQKKTYSGNGLLGGMNRQQAAHDVDPMDFVSPMAPPRRPKPGSGPMQVQAQVHPIPRFQLEYRTDAGKIRRADRRPPEEILKHGFEGTVRTDHMLAAFDNSTVFGSRETAGAEAFATGGHRDGTPDFYIYEIDTTGLRALDISANYARDADGMKSLVAEQALKRAAARGQVVSEAKRNKLPTAVDRMLQAARNAAEIQVEGPIAPSRIKLLKVIPGTPETT